MLRILLRLMTAIIETVGVPAIMISVGVIQTNSSSLTVPGRLGAASMFRRIYRKAGNQEQQH
jgi:hypothetical protein